MNLIVIIEFMRSPFEASSVAATKLPKSCLVDARLKTPYIVCTAKNQDLNHYNCVLYRICLYQTVMDTCYAS